MLLTIETDKSLTNSICTNCRFFKNNDCLLLLSADTQEDILDYCIIQCDGFEPLKPMTTKEFNSFRVTQE
jgi:hypothetical protein